MGAIDECNLEGDPIGAVVAFPDNCEDGDEDGDLGTRRLNFEGDFERERRILLNPEKESRWFLRPGVSSDSSKSRPGLCSNSIIVIASMQLE